MAITGVVLMSTAGLRMPEIPGRGGGGAGPGVRVLRTVVTAGAGAGTATPCVPSSRGCMVVGQVVGDCGNAFSGTRGWQIPTQNMQGREPNPTWPYSGSEFELCIIANPGFGHVSN